MSDYKPTVGHAGFVEYQKSSTENLTERHIVTEQVDAVIHNSADLDRIAELERKLAFRQEEFDCAIGIAGRHQARVAELERELANEKTWSNIVVSQRDGCSASLDAMTRLCRESIRFMKDDFPEDLADIDKACVSAPYLAHYKALLATAETPAEQSASDAVQQTYDAARKCAKDAL